ncbi:MAG: bifunctional metallophosphatase/5'-nucleotidase [Zhenhengia sp.]|uniref:bifunctional metallophosphatase/5'-nucleotidase n=1 Tax=Zhenhengia sp. TaxID=2944208 RepID=UPI003993D432|nr:bifunctional metallophosphatase/5'-nucleotidase [Clostridiales bacterium]
MKNLKIYFTSDVHGYVYPTDYRDQELKPQGFLCMMEQFKKDGNTLVIDGGDTIQGSPFTTYISRLGLPKNPIAEVMNKAGYDYITLGNHDFNYGYDYLKSYLDYIDAKCLCTNVEDKLNQLPIKQHAIHTLENGLKVGIIGVSTEFIPVWEKPENLKNFTVSATLDSIRPSYEALRGEVDLLIGIYHGGIEYDLETNRKLSDSKENLAYAICEAFDFDVLLTGHQHIALADKNIAGTHIVQTPQYGTQFAEVDVTVSEEGVITSTSKLVSTGLTYNKALYDELMPLESALQTWLDEPVGFLDTDLVPGNHLEMSLNGTYLANFINQVQLERSGADIACTSFANSVKGFNKEVTVRDIVSTYIFPNTLIVLEVTGSVVKAALENSASYFHIENGEISVSDKFLKPKVSHYNYDYFAPLCYTFDLTKPVGERVVSMSLNGKEVGPNDILTLAMNNYRYSGVGGYDMYPACKVVKEILVEMPEIIIDYFMQHKNVTVDKNKYITILK